MTKEERRKRYRDITVPLNVQEREDVRHERRKAYKRLYERRNATVSCRVPRDTAAAFQRLCYSYHTTPNRVLKRAVLDALASAENH